MPYEVVRRGAEWCVAKEGGGVVGCHGTEAEAGAQLRALYANEPGARTAAVEPLPLAAGIALVARDTGRVLMIQRAMIGGEPAGGKWEFPGGRLEEGEGPWEAAQREFAEESGHALPAGSEPEATWLSADGVYRGYVVLADAEDDSYVDGSRTVPDPDNASGNYTEACAWFDPSDLDRGPRIVREEARATPWSLLKGHGRKAVVADAGEIVVRVRAELDRESLQDAAAQAERAAPAAAEMESLVASLAQPASALLPEDPLPGPTPYTVADDGTADGHLALWASCHIGYPGCVKPPREESFDFFNLGDAVTADGRHVPVGKVTVGCGHAGPELSWRTAAAHYDESGTAVAVAHAVADRWGIRLPSVLVASATGEQIDELRRSPLSGDWRRVNSRLRLVASLGVNVPGYPVPRALVAAGEVHSMFLGFDPADVAAAVAEADGIAASLGLDPAGRAAALRRELLGS